MDDWVYIPDVPTKDSAILSVRVPLPLRDSIRDEAKRRKLSVSKLLNLRLAADFAFGHAVHNADEKVHDMDVEIQMETEA